MARRSLAIGAVAGVALAAGLWGFARSRRAPATSSGARTSEAPPLAAKAFYRVDAAPPPTCTTGAPCEVRFVLTALGAYHVNRDYPFKFIADPPPAVALDGAAVFTVEDERRGIMTAQVRPTAPGTAQVAGTFKLSVCSDDTCEIEAPKISIAIAVR